MYKYVKENKMQPYDHLIQSYNKSRSTENHLNNDKFKLVLFK